MDWRATLADLSGTYFVGGRRTASAAGASSPVVDPSTGLEIGSFPHVTSEEVEGVIAAAAQAQALWWSESALHRAERLHEVASRLRAMRGRLAEILTRETGKPFKESADEVDWSITAIDYFAEIGRHSAGSVIGPSVRDQLHYTVKEPMGTVVLILPANYPLVLMFWEAAAALAAGNSVIIKPSEYSTLTTLFVMDAFEGLPPGLVGCVSGTGSVGAQLVAHRMTHMVAFTGSVATGQRVAVSCAEQFKPCLIEASGSDAFIVMPSAPVDVAARAATFAAFLNAGQVCTSAERFFVHEDIYDDFIAAFIANTAALRVGPGLGHVDIGPLENGAQVERFERIMASALRQGARVAIGGERPTNLPQECANGFFVTPTVLIDVAPEMDILSDEIFGPIAPVIKVSSLDEAIELTNRSPFGLGATVYTTDTREVHRATTEIVSGMVWVNAPILDNDAGPFGGRKKSGIGRQLGTEGLDTFRHTKLVMIDPYASEHDFWWFPYKAEESWEGSMAKAGQMDGHDV